MLQTFDRLLLAVNRWLVIALLAAMATMVFANVALRFLTDFLNGDTYFRVHRPNHNLDRTRTQLRLIESIEQQEEAMQKFADSL